MERARTRARRIRRGVNAAGVILTLAAIVVAGRWLLHHESTYQDEDAARRVERMLGLSRGDLRTDRAALTENYTLLFGGPHYFRVSADGSILDAVRKPGRLEGPTPGGLPTDVECPKWWMKEIGASTEPLDHYQSRSGTLELWWRPSDGTLFGRKSRG